MHFRSIAALLILALVLSFSNAFAASLSIGLPTVILSEEGYLFGGESSFAVLQSNDSLERSLESAQSERWEIVRGRIPKSTFPRKEVWFAFQVQNRSTSTRDWTLHPESGVNTERIHYHVVRSNGDTEIIKNGAGMAFVKRPVFSRYLAAPIRIEPGETVSVFASIQSSFVAQNTFHIVSSAEFQAQEIRNVQILGFATGIVFLAGISALLFFLTLWSRAYLYFSIFCFASGIHTLLVSGFVLSLFATTENLFLGRYTIFTTSLMVMSANLFAIHFLELWKHPVRKRLFSTIVLACAIALGTGFIPGTTLGWTVVQALATISAILFVFTGISLRRYKGALLFAGSWGVYGFGVLLWTGATQGLLPASFFTVYAPMLLQAFQIIMLTLALLWHVKEIDKRRALSEILLQQSDKLKNLVRLLSHDLSNLIFAIKMRAQLCQDDPSDKNLILKNTRSVEKLCDNMSEIIESVRLMRAVEDGKVEITMQPVCLAEVLKNLKLSLESKAQTVNVGLHIENSTPEGQKVFADKVGLTHNVLANFVSNAIKFSPSGETVKVAAWQDEQGVKISVSDNGTGMPAEMLERIFDPNIQSSRLGLHGEKGTGFGMPVAKFMLDRFGGKLHIESKTKDKNQTSGTTITITLKPCAGDS
jgi:signal transduction histidine kinase